jgi:hypothetical protein
VNGLSAGRWKIGASFEGSQTDSPTPPPDTIWYPNKSQWGSARAITIRDIEAITGISIQMPQP